MGRFAGVFFFFVTKLILFALGNKLKKIILKLIYLRAIYWFIYYTNFSCDTFIFPTYYQVTILIPD